MNTQSVSEAEQEEKFTVSFAIQIPLVVIREAAAEKWDAVATWQPTHYMQTSLSDL